MRIQIQIQIQISMQIKEFISLVRTHVSLMRLYPLEIAPENHRMPTRKKNNNFSVVLFAQL